MLKCLGTQPGLYAHHTLHMAMNIIDLNADVGEGAGTDSELLSLITSATVCCGLHAGGVEEAARTIIEALHRGVTIGAHPGYADREQFGRRELPVTVDEVRHLVAYQVGALQALAESLGGQVCYVKLHGALYHQVCRERMLAKAVVRALERWQLPIVGLPASQLEAACQGRLPYIREGFLDRRYRPDGSLIPRHEAGALILDPQEAVAQAERLVRDFGIQTLCVHGDTPQAVALIREVREELLRQGYLLRSFVRGNGAVRSERGT